MYSSFINRRTNLLFFFLFTFIFPCMSYASQASNVDGMQESAIERIVKDVIAKNPNLILDVLKNNSEAVLEIAQQGNLLRRHKAMLSLWKEDAKQHKTINIEGMPFRGSANAPVTIIEFSDFTCSYCRESEAVIEELLASYKDSIKVIFKPLPKSIPISILAAKYSQAAFLQDKEKGWKFYNSLFSKTSALEAGGEGLLKSIASQVGLDIKKLQADAGSKKIADILYQSNAEAEKLNVSGTPYFLVNDLVIRGFVPKDIFEEAIKFALSLKK